MTCHSSQVKRLVKVWRQMSLARSDFAVTCAPGGAASVCVGAESRVDGEESESIYQAPGTGVDTVT